MNVDFSIVLDRDKNGAIKTTKGGDYRFTLRLKEAGKLLISVEGFRADEELDRIEPPVVYSRFGSIRIIKLDAEFEAKVLAAVKKVVADGG